MTLTATGRNAHKNYLHLIVKSIQQQSDTAITRTYFAQCLSQALSFSGLDTKLYKSHSFRIGAALWAAEEGISDAQIRTFSRWQDILEHQL